MVQGPPVLLSGLPVRPEVGGPVPGEGGELDRRGGVPRGVGVVRDAGGIGPGIAQRGQQPAVHVEAPAHRDLAGHREPPELVPEAHLVALLDEEPVGQWLLEGFEATGEQVLDEAGLHP